MRVRLVRLISIMAFVTAGGMLFAAGQGEAEGTAAAEIQVNTSGFPVVAQPLTLTATALQLPTGRALNEMPIFQQFEELTNIHIDWQMIPQSAQTEKINLIMAGRDYPDFFFHAIPNLGLPQSLGERGVIIPLDELMETYTPNFVDMLDRHPDVRTYITNPDGRIWAFPLYRNMYDINSAGDRNYINMDWLDKLGLDMPETPDDLFDVLTAFVTRDPNGNGLRDEIGLSLETGANGDISGWIAMFGSWGVPYTYMVIDGEVQLGQMQPGFKEGLQFFNRLYEAGLLDPESFTQNRQQLRAKATVDGTFKVGAFRDYVSWLVIDKAHVLYYMDFTDGRPNPNIVYDILPPLKGPEGQQLWPRAVAVPNLSPAATFIASANAYPEATARWNDIWMDGTDWGYSAEEGQKDVNWGVNDEGFAYAFDPPEGVTRNDWRSQVTYTPRAHYWDNDLLPQIIQYGWLTQAEMVDKYRPYFDDEQRFPSEYFPLAEEDEIINRYWPGILLYINENMTRFMTGDLDIDRNWDAYLRGFGALGLDQVLTALQARYDRFVTAGGN